MITNLEIDGYRLLNGFKADLRPLTVVIGANAVGKSTLLDCLQCISECVENPLNKVLERHWGMLSLLNAAQAPGRLSWKITFRKPDNPVWNQLPLEGDREVAYDVVLQPDAQGQAFAQYEALRRSEPSPGFTEPFNYLEATPSRRRIFDPRSGRRVPFNEALPRSDSTTEPDEEGQSNEQAPRAQVQEPTLMLSQIRFFNEFPILSAARFLLASMAFYPGFDVTRFSNLRTKAAEIRPIVTLVSNGENLGTVLHEILTRYDYRNSAAELSEFLAAAYPSFEAIHCDTTFGMPPQVLVRVREKSMRRSMELSELSDGMLRFLCLGTALLNPLAPPIVGLDEPEVGLHPRLFPIVADMIKTASERTQVLVTTHSPDLLNRFDITDIAVMARVADEPRAAWHRPAELRDVQIRLVKDSLERTFGIGASRLEGALNRFRPTAFKHDLEMLLLAAHAQLRAFLGTTDKLGDWRHPVEEQDQANPPKFVVEGLFRSRKGRRYRDTTDAKGVLEKVVRIEELFYSASGQAECPVFKETIDWIGARTGVPAYQ